MTATAVERDSVETGVCVRCGRSHAASNRRRLIRPIAFSEEVVPSQVAAIREAWPCFYQRTDASDRRLYRDLKAIGWRRQ